MSYTVVQKINNNYYLYEVTAVWDPEKKNSRQKRKYIGKCDEKGNLIKTKDSQAPRIKELGKPYLMYQVANHMGLREKLVDAIGDDGNVLFTIAINRSTRVGLPRHSVLTMMDSLLPQMTGVNIDMILRDTSGTIVFMDRIFSKKEAIFHNLEKGNKVMVYQLDSLRTVDVMHINSEDPSLGLIKFPPMDVYLAISDTPNSAFYYSIIRDRYPISDVLSYVESSIQNMGPRNITFFLNKGPLDEESAIELANSGAQFLRTIPEDSPYGRKLLKEYDEEIIRNGRPMVVNNNLQRVLDRQIVLGDIRCRIIIVSNELMRVSQMNVLYKSISDYENNVSKLKSAPASRVSENVAEEDVSTLFTTESIKGGFTVKRNPEAIRDTEIALGRKIIITNSDEPWEDLVIKYFRHDRFKNEVERFRNDLQDGSMLMVSLEAAVSTFLNEFLAIVLRTHLSDMLGMSKADTGWDYVDVLNAVSSIHAIYIDGKWQISELTPQQKAIFERLGIPEPTAEFVEECVSEYSKKNSL